MATHLYSSATTIFQWLPELICLIHIIKNVPTWNSRQKFHRISQCPFFVHLPKPALYGNFPKFSAVRFYCSFGWARLVRTLVCHGFNGHAIFPLTASSDLFVLCIWYIYSFAALAICWAAIYNTIIYDDDDEDNRHSPETVCIEMHQSVAVARWIGVRLNN